MRTAEVLRRRPGLLTQRILTNRITYSLNHEGKYEKKCEAASRLIAANELIVFLLLFVRPGRRLWLPSAVPYTALRYKMLSLKNVYQLG